MLILAAGLLILAEFTDIDERISRQKVTTDTAYVKKNVEDQSITIRRDSTEIDKFHLFVETKVTSNELNDSIAHQGIRQLDLALIELMKNENLDHGSYSQDTTGTTRIEESVGMAASLISTIQQNQYPDLAEKSINIKGVAKEVQMAEGQKKQDLIKQFFVESSDFLDNALKNNNNRLSYIFH
jgi:hypothetical protein